MKKKTVLKNNRVKKFSRSKINAHLLVKIFWIKLKQMRNKVFIFYLVSIAHLIAKSLIYGGKYYRTS